jgi:hypothetical protein
MFASVPGAELSTATAINPYTAAIESPGLSLNTGRSANLPRHDDIAAATRNGAVLSISVIGRAGKGLSAATSAIPVAAAVAASADDEVSAATSVDPDAVAIPTPGLSLIAW